MLLCPLCEGFDASALYRGFGLLVDIFKERINQRCKVKLIRLGK